MAKKEVLFGDNDHQPTVKLENQKKWRFAPKTKNNLVVVRGSGKLEH